MIFQNLKAPYILAAPLCGYTTSPYREVLQKFPYDIVFTEMVSVDALFYKNEQTQSIYHVSPHQDRKRLGTQLFGSKTDRFLYAVEHLSTKENFQVFDINCGCPVNKVTKTGGGSALLKTPEKIYEILYNLTKEFPHLNFSAKIRIGINSKERPYMEVAKAIEAGGASFLTVHGRTQSQIYSGDVDYAAIQEIKQNSKIPIIGNGGIFGPKEAIEFLKHTNVDGIMIARGLIGTPWIAKYIREALNQNGSFTPLSWKEKVLLMREHFQRERDFSPRGFMEFKKSGVLYLKGLSHSKPFRVRLALAPNPKEMEDIFDELLSNIDRWEHQAS